jgi:hypothetical protein
VSESAQRLVLLQGTPATETSVALKPNRTCHVFTVTRCRLHHLTGMKVSSMS